MTNWHALFSWMYFISYTAYSVFSKFSWWVRTGKDSTDIVFCLQKRLLHFSFGYFWLLSQSWRLSDRGDLSWQEILLICRGPQGGKTRIKREHLIYVLFYIQCIWNYIFLWRLLQAQNWQWGIIYPQEKWQGQHFKVKFNASVEWSNNNCASHSSVLPFITEHTKYQNFYILYLVSSHNILYSTSLPIVFAYFFSYPRQS